MEEFLQAQTSGDLHNKEEKWRELVRVMKMPRFARSRSRSSSSSNNEILGVIRVGGGESVSGDSFASGLTSPTSSPVGSPREHRKGSLPLVSPMFRNGKVMDDDLTFPSLPAESLLTFPSLPGNNTSEDEMGKLAQKRGEGITESRGANITPNEGSKEESNNSTWDVFEGISGSRSAETNSIVKNLVGRYEHSINKSMSQVPQQPAFFQRTNPASNKEILTTQKPEKETDIIQQREVQASTPTPQTEVDASATSHKSRKSRRESSLEEQVRNVLEKQQSLALGDITEDYKFTRTPSSSSLPLEKPAVLSKRIKSESVASAQDILAELRGSTSTSPTPIGKCPLPRSISLGGKSPVRLNSSEVKKHSPDRSTVSPSPLAPSRRDLPRQNRLYRRSVSESNTAHVAELSLFSKTSPTSGSKADVNGISVGGPPSVCTTPTAIGSGESTKNNTASAGTLNNNKPRLPPSKRDSPTLSSPDRTLPSVKEIAAKFNSQTKLSSNESSSFSALSPPNQLDGWHHKTHISTTSRSVASNGSKERIDEIRASITKLKHDGVGGVGKATSTLVRNQETGRYVIRDVGDDQFDDAIIWASSTEINEQSLQEQLRVVTKMQQGVNHFDGDGIGDTRTVFRMPSNESSVSDGAVDDAVRAVIDAISSTSTDGMINDQSSVAANDNDDFFVTENSNKWTTFQSQLNTNNHVSDVFDINPLNDWDDSSDEFRGESTSFGSTAKTNYPSPTSVIQGPNRKMLRQDKSKSSNLVAASWNPFDM